MAGAFLARCKGGTKQTTRAEGFGLHLLMQLAECPSRHRRQGMGPFPVAGGPEEPRLSSAWRKVLLQEWGALSSCLGAEGLSQGRKAKPISLALRLLAGTMVGGHYASSIRISGQWK